MIKVSLLGNKFICEVVFLNLLATVGNMKSWGVRAEFLSTVKESWRGAPTLENHLNHNFLYCMLATVIL